ncbi:HNH endonuclease [Cellulomonas hominis]|uniref:HNH endonuclease n=1 Tax=Cellulomonas hominis TaxID=156981 RepID=A0A7Z8K144_9CELL|nr:HNH endonuclease [Cellulomonas hominis]
MRTTRTSRSTAPRRRPAARGPRGRARGGRLGWAWLVLVVAVALGAGLPVWSESRESARFPVTAADLDRARTELAGLEVKGRAPKTGYEREQFGPAWADVDRNGCDTRNDVLARDLTDVTFEAGTHDCVVLTGTLQDPYTDQVIAFERGPRSAEVQIDHVVALSDAWQKGAQQWDAETRRQFANDPANLLAVDGPANGAKGDGDAATWLPASTGYRCAYVVRQVRVKAAYGLWVTRAERDAIARQLDGCAVAG